MKPRRQPPPVGSAGAHKGLMKDPNETPFDSVEGAQEYLNLLADAVLEAKNEVAADIQSSEDPASGRRLEALRLVLFKLEKLQGHVKSSRRLLNDLRTLRRLLLGKRAGLTGQEAE